MSENIVYNFIANDKFSETIRKISSSFEGLDKKLGKISESSKKFEARFKNLTNVGKSMSAAITLPAIGIATYAVKQINDLQRLQKQLEFTTGSADKAKTVLASIKKVSISTGIDPEKLSSAAQRMLSLGFSVDKTVSKLKILANISEGSGADLEGLASATARMEIQASKLNGAVNSRALISFTNQNVALVATMKKLWAENGKSSASFDDALKNNRLGIDLVNKALETLSKNEATQNVGHSLERMHQFARYFAADLFSALFPVDSLNDKLKKTTDHLYEIEKRMIDFVKNHPLLVKIGLAVAAFGIAFGPALMAIAQIAKILVIVIEGVAAVGAGVAAGIVAGIIAAVAALYYMYKYWDKIKEAITTVFDYIKSMADYILNTFANIYNKVIGNITGHPIIISQQSGSTIQDQVAQNNSLLNSTIQNQAMPMYNNHSSSNNIRLTIKDPGKQVNKVVDDDIGRLAPDYSRGYGFALVR